MNNPVIAIIVEEGGQCIPAAYYDRTLEKAYMAPGGAGTMKQAWDFHFARAGVMPCEKS